MAIVTANLTTTIEAMSEQEARVYAQQFQATAHYVAALTRCKAGIIRSGAADPAEAMRANEIKLGTVSAGQQCAGVPVPATLQG